MITSTDESIQEYETDSTDNTADDNADVITDKSSEILRLRI